MLKRLCCAILAALTLAAGARAQEPPPVLDAAPPAPATDNAAQESPEARGILVPIADWARSFAGASSTSDVHVWANADYMFAFFRGSKLPPLVTTSPSGTPKSEAGILGEPSTSILYGDSKVDNDLRAGFRIGTGIWFNREQTLGLEAGFLMTSSEAGIYSANSSNGTILARPFINANNNTNQAVLVAFPGSSNGAIDIRANSGNLFGANLDLTENACDIGWFRLYSMIGYQFYRYDDSLRTQQNIQPSPGGIFVAGTQIYSNDNFSTANEFHGLDLGFRSQFNFWDNLSLELLTKLAVGQMHRDVAINGNQTVTVPGVNPVTLPGGVFALSSNSGHYAETDWRAIPQVGATLCWEPVPNLKLRAGYSFIFFNQIVRAADQVDATINPNLIPGANAALGGPQRPAFNISRTDMWVQTINLGLEFAY